MGQTSFTGHSFLCYKQWRTLEKSGWALIFSDLWWVDDVCGRCMVRGKIEKESEVAQSCPTLCNPVDCSLPGSSIHGISEARILEWIAISFSRGSFQPRDGTWVSCITGKRFTVWATREAPNEGKQKPKLNIVWFLLCETSTTVNMSIDRKHISVC